MRIVDKLLQTLRFARYGPTRVEELEARLRASREEGAQALRALQDAMQSAAQVDETRRGEQAHVNVALQQQVLQAHERIGLLVAQLGDAERRAAALAHGTREELLALRNQLLALVAAVDRLAAGDSPRPGAPSPGAAALEESFYPLLEAHFRGSEGDVERRMSAYREWVDAMPAGTIADLGCGRGEWLSLLARWGRQAVGVDSNAVVVAELRARGQPAEQADAIEWLHAQPGASLAGITVFHVVEHMPFGAILRLMMEAHRALVPGGKLIIETPNPENVTVSTHSFWLDPTHLRPLPPELLELALRHCRFEPPAVLRLHPPEDASGPGRDYALVAGKAAAQ